MSSQPLGPVDPAAVRPRALRLFVALWPDDDVRAAVSDVAAGWRWPAGARPVPAAKRHLTLHFLGAQPPDRLSALAQAIELRWEGCELTLDRPACWRNGVAVLEPAEPPPALLALHAALAQALAAAGAAIEKRPWKPHLTLARDASGSLPPAAFAPVRWRVDGHALVESVPGQGYRVLHRVRCGSG